MQGMSRVARTYLWWIALGFVIVLSALGIGAANSQTAAAYFSQSKAVRESTLMAARASFESIDQWLPYFKFLGLGLILGGIVLALVVINNSLQGVSQRVVANLPPGRRPAMPRPPLFGRLSLALLVVGLAVFLSALAVAAYTAVLATQVFADPVPVIDAAGAGSPLLAQLRTIETLQAWLVPYKFLGVSTLFTAIVLGLAAIVSTLSVQTQMTQQGIRTARTAAREQAERAPEAMPAARR